MFWISLVLALCILVVAAGGLWNRHANKKGIGWQFIRFNVIAMSLPLIGLLAINDALSSELVTLIGVLVGYAFGKSGENNDA